MSATLRLLQRSLAWPTATHSGCRQVARLARSTLQQQNLKPPSSCCSPASSTSASVAKTSWPRMPSSSMRPTSCKRKIGVELRLFLGLVVQISLRPPNVLETEASVATAKASAATVQNFNILVWQKVMPESLFCKTGHHQSALVVVSQSQDSLG